jgi:adenylylsulfate kinase
MIIWLTGRPASGKTSIARSLVNALEQRRVASLWLDGDELRSILTPSPTYDPKERDWFYGAVGELALIGERGGCTVIISATGSKRMYRDRVRERARRFVEVYLDCPSEICKARDPKRLYARAQAKEIAELPGAGAAYEEPLHPEIELDSGSTSPDALAKALLRRLDDAP